MRTDIKVRAGFPSPSHLDKNHRDYVSAIEQNIIGLLEKNTSFEPKEKTEAELHQVLPIVSSFVDETTPSIIKISLICGAQYTHGTGMFSCDICSRWLIPGNQLPIVSTSSLLFEFEHLPKTKFFYHDVIIEVQRDSDLQIIKTNLPKVLLEIKLSILAVQHARKVVISKELTYDQKKLIIEENVASLINRPSKIFDNSLFDQVHHLLIKASAENKETQIKDQISPLLDLKPKAFDRDIFNEIQHFVLLYRNNFTGIRDLKHLYRIISYQYLFRKVTEKSITTNPLKRHLSLKIFKTKLDGTANKKAVLGVLAGLNLLHENEVFEERHLLKAIQSLIPDTELVPSSSIIDRRGNEKLRMVYLEIEKRKGLDFSLAEIKMLQKNLRSEVKSRIECVVHPIFVHRNEEEIMKNILTLNNELKYVDDIPQIAIQFHEQSPSEISFVVILIRILRNESKTLKDLLLESNTPIRIKSYEVKNIGKLKNRYTKEANVLEVSVDNKPFIRKDYSINLHKARKHIFSLLSSALGELRDYNGGMFSKQDETLLDLKKLLLERDIKNDFLLENYFYSISPIYMQSVLQPEILKESFTYIQKCAEFDFQTSSLFHCEKILGDYYTFTVSCTNKELTDKILSSVSDIHRDLQLIHAKLQIHDIHILQLIAKCENKEDHQFFEGKLQGIVFPMLKHQTTGSSNQINLEYSPSS